MVLTSIKKIQTYQTDSYRSYTPIMLHTYVLHARNSGIIIKLRKNYFHRGPAQELIIRRSWLWKNIDIRTKSLVATRACTVCFLLTCFSVNLSCLSVHLLNSSAFFAPFLRVMWWWTMSAFDGCLEVQGMLCFRQLWIWWWHGK